MSKVLGDRALGRRSGRFFCQLFCPLFCFAQLLTLCLLWGRSARAEEWPYNPSEEKAGRVMLNVRGGPAFGVMHTEDQLRFLGAVGIDFGVAVSADRNAYLVLTPTLQLKEGFYNVLVPLGFQYDIRLARGVYFYPRVSLGYAATIATSSLDVGPIHFMASETQHYGVAIPEVGFKFVPGGRVNIGIEPFSMPIVFDSQNYLVWYRANLYLGFNL
jgi:hypothetical protein